MLDWEGLASEEAFSWGWDSIILIKYIQSSLAINGHWSVNSLTRDESEEVELFK